MHKDYIHDPMYNVDVGVACPPDFRLDFIISADVYDVASASKIITELSDGSTSLKLIPFFSYDDRQPSPIVPKGATRF